MPARFVLPLIFFEREIIMGLFLRILEQKNRNQIGKIAKLDDEHCCSVVIFLFFWEENEKKFTK